LTIAFPLAPLIVDILRQVAYAVDVILSPETLHSVRQFYENFGPITHDQVREILIGEAHFW
jgi:predicted phosphoribosyltransferase